MKWLWLISLLFSAVLAQAEECGLFSVEDFGDRISYTIIDFQTQKPRTKVFHIVNTTKGPVSSMVNGLCYCVDGNITSDPSYPGDEFYKLITVTRVMTAPYQGCGPQAQMGH